VRVECPKCASGQWESIFVQTTLCRKCGHSFKPIAPSDAANDSTKAGSFLKKVSLWFSGEKHREIQCYHCDGAYTISNIAESSMCPHCGKYADLKDYRIKGVYSRSIETYGEVYVSSKGELTSPKVICGKAVIRGKVHGSMICRGTVRIRWRERLTVAIDSHEVVVEKGSEVEFVRLIKAQRVEIAGKVVARIQADKVHITKGGTLEGTVYAKAITVEKGAIFSGELVIGQKELEQGELLPVSPKRSRSPSIKGQQRLALGDV